MLSIIGTHRSYDCSIWEDIMGRYISYIYEKMVRAERDASTKRRERGSDSLVCVKTEAVIS
jgi:hypothetical protein